MVLVTNVCHGEVGVKSSADALAGVWSENCQVCRPAPGSASHAKDDYHVYAAVVVTTLDCVVCSWLKQSATKRDVNARRGGAEMTQQQSVCVYVFFFCVIARSKQAHG